MQDSIKQQINSYPNLSAYSQIEDISLNEIFSNIWFLRRMMFSITILLMIIGFVGLYQMTPKYTATASLMVGIADNKIVDISEVVDSKFYGEMSLRGEIEIISSRDLVKKVIKKLNLIERPEFNPSLRPASLFSQFNPKKLIPEEWLLNLQLGQSASQEKLTAEEREELKLVQAANIFLAKLEIKKVRLANVIRINFTSEDSKLAAKITNVLADSYIVGQMEAKLDATRKATRWLDDQMYDLKNKLADSEKSVEIYRAKHGIVKGVKAEILNEQLSAINQQLIIANAESAGAKARYRQVSRLTKNGSVDIESASEVLSSNLIQLLRHEESNVERKISELSIEHGNKHPKMLQAKAEARDLRNKIKLEIKKITNGLKNELEVAKSRAYSLAKSLNKLKAESGAQKGVSIQLRALEREASANRTLFETFLNRFKETSSTQDIQQADARIISKAEIPNFPSAPKTGLISILIIVGSFFIAIVIVFMVSNLNSGLMTPEQIEKELGLSTIGLLPKVKKKNPLRYIVNEPNSSFAEALNSLHISLMLSDPGKQLKTLQVTSSVPEEGKSTLALTLSTTLAKSSKKVLLIDADLRRASIEKQLGTAKHKNKGFTDIILMDEDVPLNDFISKDEPSGIYFMGRGTAQYLNSTEIFSSQRMKDIISAFSKQFDYVIFDTPPIMAVSDARIIARLVDETVFVVRWNKTPQKVVKAAIKLLRKQDDDVKLAGCVLQQVDMKKYSYGYGYNGSGYYYHYGRYKNYYTS